MEADVRLASSKRWLGTESDVTYYAVPTAEHFEELQSCLLSLE